LIALKSDGRYYSTGPPASMFAHELFKDADAEIFARVGSSSWTSLHRVKVERRIGSREVPPDVR
jgi:hypothetical protein